MTQINPMIRLVTIPDAGHLVHCRAAGRVHRPRCSRSCERAAHELVAVYEDPSPVLAQWRGRVVGYLGADVPRELVAAAGLAARSGSAEPARRRRARTRSSGRGVDRPVRRVLGELLEGQAAVDFLLLTHESDSLVRLFTSLRVLPDPLPELWFLDLLHLPTETTAAYNAARLEELRGGARALVGAACRRERGGRPTLRCSPA